MDFVSYRTNLGFDPVVPVPRGDGSPDSPSSEDPLNGGRSAFLTPHLLATIVEVITLVL